MSDPEGVSSLAHAEYSSIEPGYNEAVPLSLDAVTNYAISKEISRIQSRRSSCSQNFAQLQQVEAKKEPDEVEVIDKEMVDERYNRFSVKRKRIIVGILSLAGFISPVSSLAMLPAIPEISARFNTTGEVINISVAVYCIFMAISPCIFSPISDIYGRKFTLLICSGLFIIGNVLAAVSVNLAMFFVFRAVVALSGTALFSVNGHVIADIFVPTQRGQNMSWVLVGSQIGSAVGAVGGGIIVNFTSWRVIFWAIAGLGFIVFLSSLFILPETSTVTKHQLVLRELRKENPSRRFKFIFFNPFRVITALKYPNLFIDGYITISILFTMYSLLTPIRYVIDPRFNIQQPIISGLFYLPQGLGCLVGSFFGGKWADNTVKKYIEIQGRRIPEDRLRTVLFPLGIVYPVAVLIYGWSLDKEKGGMAVPIIFMFISGVAQTCIFPASNTYCVDAMPELGGDGIASSYFSRYIAAAVASATCLRSINNIGIGWTCTICSLLLWLGLLCAMVLIKWGEGMRVKALVRYGLRDE